MALPDLSKLSAFDLMELAEHQVFFTAIIVDHRRSEGRPDNDALSIEELLWLQRIIDGAMIKEALKTLPLEKVMRGLGKEMGWLEGKGPHRNYIYILAWWHMNNTELKPMQIYYQWVQPVLLAQGTIGKNPKGEPDPTQDLAAQKDFLKALARFRKTPKK